MASIHGVTTETVKRFLIDAGAVYLNYDEADERLLGATRGGNSFVIEQDVKEMEMDGAKGPVKGARRIIEVRARITANLLELTADNIQKALAGSAAEDYPSAEGKTHDKITRVRDISDSDYLTNVALVGRISGSDNNFIGIVKNALAVENFELTTEPREEGVIEVTFEAHFDPSDLDSEPWEIYFPVIETAS
ncbi:MAG: hypothetical protein ACTSPI_00640 [Candidatus Heimdallarchaeaceae archaeon]